MRRIATVMAIVLGGALFAASQATSETQSAPFPSGLPDCAEARPCVYVTPDPVFFGSGTSFTFAGQGWQAGHVQVSYTEECGPECEPGVVRARAAVDEQGRFAFTLEQGDGGGQPRTVRVAQRQGGELVRRRAGPVPARPSARQRREARSLGRAVKRVHRALERRESAALGAADERFRAVDRCSPPQEEAYATEARGAVQDAIAMLSVDEATYSAVGGPLRAFARDLRRLRVRDRELRAATDTWVALITHRARERWTLKRACRALRRWHATGYDPARRPIDPDTVTTFEQLVTRNTVLDAGGARLRALGVGRASALRFAGGLLEPGELHGLFG